MKLVKIVSATGCLYYKHFYVRDLSPNMLFYEESNEEIKNLLLTKYDDIFYKVIDETTDIITDKDEIENRFWFDIGNTIFGGKIKEQNYYHNNYIIIKDVVIDDIIISIEKKDLNLFSNQVIDILSKYF